MVEFPPPLQHNTTLCFIPRPSRLRRNSFGPTNFDNLHVLSKSRTPTQDAQKGRPARPQRVKIRGVPSGVR